MLLVKNYFEPQDEGEDYFYHIDADQNRKYEILESIYNRIYSNKTTQEAKDISLYIRDKNQYADKSLTYGEVTFRSMAYIFEYCKSRFDLNEEGNFVDLGSGIGCAVISAVLCSCFKKYIGVEFISALNDKANINKNKFMDMFLDINKEFNNYLPDYIFDEKLKNEIVFEKKEETKEEEVIEEEEREEEEEEEDKIDEEENLKNYMMSGSGSNNAQNVLDIIYGKKNQNDEEGYLSYAKKCEIRNKKFLEEYDRKQKILEKKNAKNEKDDQKENQNTGRIKNIHELIHGEGGFLQKLETPAPETISEKSESSSKKSSKKNIKENANKKNSENNIEKVSVSNKSKSETTTSRIITPYIEFSCGNFMNLDLTESSFIFINSTCFSSELLLQISKKLRKEAPNGCIVITFTKKLPFINANEWEVKKGFKRLMSWGLATVFVHRRIKSMNTTHTSGSYNSDTKKNSLYSSKTSKSSSSNS